MGPTSVQVTGLFTNDFPQSVMEKQDAQSYKHTLWCKALEMESQVQQEIIHIPMTQTGASHVLLRENIIMFGDGFVDVSF
jgi:hypothetical protein